MCATFEAIYFVYMVKNIYIFLKNTLAPAMKRYMV